LKTALVVCFLSLLPTLKVPISGLPAARSIAAIVMMMVVMMVCAVAF